MNGKPGIILFDLECEHFFIGRATKKAAGWQGKYQASDDRTSKRLGILQLAQDSGKIQLLAKMQI